MSDRLISRNTKLLRGAGQTIHEYHAGPNINITEDVISGRDWTQDIQNAVNSGVAGQLSAGDNIALNTENNITTISVTGDLYSAGDNINITDHTISGKDWTNDIYDQIASAISGKADTSAIPEIVEYSAGNNIDISNHVISGKDWSYEIGQKADRAEVIERISAASESIVNNLTETISSTSGELIDIISATSGEHICPWITGGTSYSGEYLEIGPGDIVPIISGWDLGSYRNHHIWLKGRYMKFPGEETFVLTSSYNSFISGAFWPNIDKLYGSALYLDVNKLAISDFTAYSAAHSGDDNTPYSAGANINITNHVVSGRNWQSEINAAVSGKQDKLSAGSHIAITNNVVSVTGEMGKVYSGQAPIRVDNTNDIIGLDPNANYTCLPGTNIAFVEDTTEKTVTINGTYDASPEIHKETSGLVPYSAMNTYTDAFSNTIVSSIDDLNGEPLLFSAKYADYATLAASAQFDSIGRPLYQLASQNQLSAYIPFRSVAGDSATSSISAINGSACGGDKIDYIYSTPAGTTSATGNLHIRRQVGASSPDKINVYVNDTGVGLLAPTGTVNSGMLVTNAQGAVSWQPQSALIPNVSAKASYYTKALSFNDDIDWALTAHPPMDHDWILDIYNDTDGESAKYFYWSGGGATGTIEPGEGVRMHYNVQRNYLIAEPTYLVGVDGCGYGDIYARCYDDLDGVKIRVVKTSAKASAWNTLYIVTGTN